MPTLDRTGVEIHYEVSGVGPPILMTHGFAATSAMFSETARHLATDHRVVRWDLRGHGSSGSPADPDFYSVPLVMGDMLALLDRLEIERCVLLGHSIGGYLSLHFALTHPARVRALVLEDTGPGFRSEHSRAGWNEVAEGYAVALSEHGLEGLPPGAELEADAHASAVGLVHAARRVLVQRDALVLEGLGSIAVPTLVVVGADDDGFVPGSRYMAARS